jgi:NADH dehydrogenase
LSGFLGWLMWLVVHLVNVISFRSRIVVLVNWAWDYLFYDRPIRLILRAKQGAAPPQDDQTSQKEPTRG